MAFRCRDCGDEDYLCERKERGRSDVCDTCWEVRGQFVKAIDCGLVTHEQMMHCQRGRYTRRKKMLAVMAEAIHAEGCEDKAYP